MIQRFHSLTPRVSNIICGKKSTILGTSKNDLTAVRFNFRGGGSAPPLRWMPIWVKFCNNQSF